MPERVLAGAFAIRLTIRISRFRRVVAYFEEPFVFHPVHPYQTFFGNGAVGDNIFIWLWTFLRRAGAVS